jgi:hypothetical protein
MGCPIDMELLEFPARKTGARIGVITWGKEREGVRAPVISF